MMLPVRILMMLVLINVVVGSDAKNTSIGTTKNIYLLCVGLDKFIRYRLSASVEFSLDLVNNRSDIIPGYILQKICGFSTKYNDIGHIVKEFITQISNPPTKVMIIGPMFTPEAKVIAETSALYSLVEISYFVTSPEMSDTNKYPYFARTIQSTALRNPAMIRVLRYYNWSKVAIISQNLDYVLSASVDLKNLLKKENITLLSAITFDDSPAQVVRQIKESAARIIIVFTGHVAVRHVMCQVYLQNVYGPRHQWLFWEKKQLINLPEERYLGTGCSKQQVLYAYNYLIVFSPAKPSKEDDDTIVGDSGYTTSELRRKYSEYLDHHGYEQSLLSTTAFDAIWVAAKTLNASIERLQPNETIDQFSYDNSRMTKIFFDSLTKLQFEGASGHISFDENGDRSSLILISQHTADGHVKDVGQYNPEDNSLAWSKTIPVRFPGGRPPPDADILITNTLKMDKVMYWLATCLASLGVVFCTVCVAFNVYYSNLKVIKMSSPKINTVIAIGCGMALLFIPLLGVDNPETIGTNWLCSTRLVVLVCGFTFAYGGMFAKTWRVHVIFTSKKPLKRPVRDAHLMAFVGVVMLVDIILLVAWQISDPLVLHLFNINQEIQADGAIISRQAYICTSKYVDQWMGALCGFKALLLIFGIFFAWETRKVRVEVLNDSKEIGICVYNIMIMSVVSVPIYRLLPLQQMDVSFGVISISVFVCALTTLLLVFGPKMHLVATGGQRVDDCAVLPFASSINQKKRTTAGGMSSTVEDCPGPSTSSRC
ncbi:Gamma-aminobutyric acid type B receptor subunit 1 [Lamellibrachia satsuma]|nr:Gamma-aminobutyric acid type B receptor subunit 1 [Lamellibrachia satsuma]